MGGSFLNMMMMQELFLESCMRDSKEEGHTLGASSTFDKHSAAVSLSFQCLLHTRALCSADGTEIWLYGGHGLPSVESFMMRTDGLEKLVLASINLSIPMC